LAISDGQPENRRQRDAVLAAMQPWSTGMTYPNFNGVEDTSIDAVRRSYGGAAFRRLQQLQHEYDPDNMFRVNFNIPPKDECALIRSPTAIATFTLPSMPASQGSRAGRLRQDLAALRLPVHVSQLRSAPEPLTGGATPKPRHKKRV
ncbi:MAG: BBE domain-containing protein, partial [Chloroflexi bacterium]|nr:BBE domain-containing protein [Chloroflexota bacterium]